MAISAIIIQHLCVSMGGYGYMVATIHKYWNSFCTYQIRKNTVLGGSLPTPLCMHF